MVHMKLTICNELGFHARAAARFVQESSRSKSQVWLTKGSQRVNGKSIMGILTLAAARGEEITVEVEGPDENETLDALGKLVRGGFEEKNEKLCQE
jgi:phosphocarrier protein